MSTSATPGTSSTVPSVSDRHSSSIRASSDSVAGLPRSRASTSPRLRANIGTPYPCAAMLACWISASTGATAARSVPSQPATAAVTRSKRTLFSHNVSSASKISTWRTGASPQSPRPYESGAPLGQ